MNLKLQTLLTLLIFYSFTLKAQQVKLYSEIDFTENGRVASFNGSLYTGRVIDKDPKGNKNYEANYKNGLLDGKCTEWDENGQKQSEINYSNGMKDGIAIYFDGSGKEFQEISYKNDGANGDWVTFQNGAKRSVTKYVNDSTAIEFQVYTADGKPDSTWNYYSPDGKLLERTENYANGVKEGKWITYDQNGNAATTYYHNGVEDKYSHFLVSGYEFNSPASYLLKIPVSSKSNEFNEFIINDPQPTDQQYTDFINKIADHIAKIRGSKFIKSNDVAGYNNDTISKTVTLTNVNIVTKEYDVANSNGTYTPKFTTTLDADLVTGDLHENTTSTTHLHSNNPAIGFANNQSDWAFSSALNRDDLKSAVMEYLNTNFPVKANLTQVVKSSSNGDAQLVTLNRGADDFIKEDMKFKLSGNPANTVELKVKDVSSDHCTCKVEKGGSKIAELMKQPGAMPLFVLRGKD